jgi:hypothetical protein
MGEKTKSLFLIAIDYVPFITGIIISLGCLRLIAFYTIFNLSIFNYTDLSDFVSQGITDFLFILFYTFLGISFPTIKNPFKDEMENGLINSDILLENSGKLLRLMEYIPYLVLAWFLLYGTIDYIKTQKFEIYDRLYLLGGIGYGIGLYFSIQLGRLYLKHNQHKINKTILVFIPMMSFYFIGSLWNSYTSALSVKYQQENIGNAITINKEIHISSKSYYFIGQTKTYVFFHNEQNNTNDIFPKALISKITLSH